MHEPKVLAKGPMIPKGFTIVQITTWANVRRGKTQGEG